MRTLGLAIIAALALGCSNTLTAPSPAITSDLVAEQAAKPAEHQPGTTKVILYFYGPQLDRAALHNMPVVVTHPLPGGGTETHTLYTGKQHSVSLDVAKGTAWVDWAILPGWDGVAPANGRVMLPYATGANWILLSPSA